MEFQYLQWAVLEVGDFMGPVGEAIAEILLPSLLRED